LFIFVFCIQICVYLRVVRHFRQTSFDNLTMLKKSLKYLIIVFVNTTLLALLLVLWTDRLELAFNCWVRPRGFLKITGFAILSLISISILVSCFRRRSTTTTTLKIQISALLTLLISSYLYIDYTAKVVNNVILNRQFRNQIADKIKPSNFLANGTKGDSLTIKEYQQITKMYWFPKLPDEASNISYTYGYDGFLPDYLFTLTYNLPAQMKVDTINIRKGDFSKCQSFVTVDNIKRVTYSQGEE
jgi:hypothetical protein